MYENHRISVVLLRCYNMSRKNFWRLCFESIIPRPTCRRKNYVLCMQLMSSQLLTHDCCTICLHIRFLVVSRIHFTPINSKNNMDSAQNIGLESACLWPVCFLTKPRLKSFKSFWPSELALFGMHCVPRPFRITWGQYAEVRGKSPSRNSAITCGVRQRCVVSPPLFSAVLQWAMQIRGATLFWRDLT